MNKILCVDLDGTFVKTDMLYESFLFKFKKNPLVIFSCIFWLLIGGKVLLKSKLAENFDFDVSALPYNEDVVVFCHSKKEQGCDIFLVSASNGSICEKIEQNFSFFTPICKPNDINLAGSNKADFLVKKFGEKKFDYVGNSSVDLAIWEKSEQAFCVNCSKSLVECCKKLNSNTIYLENKLNKKKKKVKSFLKMIRAHQWVKNLLVFTPLLASHSLPLVEHVLAALGAFVAFSLLASSVYITNDLLDLENDRKHRTKKNRPLAAGNIPIPFAFFNIPLFIGGSYIVACLIGGNFLIGLTAYFIITVLYSFILKKVAIVDCLTLSILYTGRIIAGCLATGLPHSQWLMIFSLFFFLSLAFIKRYAELFNAKRDNKKKAGGRGYVVEDLDYVGQAGLASGFLSILIFVLYIKDPVIQATFGNIYITLCSLPILIYWISYLFLKSFRGEMLEDPVVFSIKDKRSLLAGICFAIVFFLGGVL